MKYNIHQCVLDGDSLASNTNHSMMCSWLVLWLLNC